MRLVKIHATGETKWLENACAYRLINAHAAQDVTDTPAAAAHPLPAPATPQKTKTKEKPE